MNTLPAPSAAAGPGSGARRSSRGPAPRADWEAAPEPPTPTGPPDGVELWLRLDSHEVRSGVDLEGTLVEHNTAATPVLLTGGGATRIATVLDERGAVAGTFAEFMMGVEMHRTVDPDRIVYLPVLGGTAGRSRVAVITREGDTRA